MGSSLREEERALYLRTIFDSIPMPTFIVDEDVRIHDLNTAAEEFLGDESPKALDCRAGDVFRCVNAEKQGCGKAELCRTCVIRNSVNKAAAGRNTQREIHVAKLRGLKRMVKQKFLVSTTLLPFTESPRVLLILEDISRILALRGARSAQAK